MGAYSQEWLQQRPISGGTRYNYRRLLRNHILPTFALIDMRDITPQVVATWYADTAAHPPTVRAHTYALLRSILQDAVSHNIIDANPCQISGVSTSWQAEQARPVTVEDVEAIAAVMPEAYQTLIPMTAWLGMASGEVRELRRKDIDLSNNVVRVRRAVVLAGRRFQVTAPRSRRGIRDIPIPPALAPRITAHLREHVELHQEALLFPAMLNPDHYLAPSVLYSMVRHACIAAGQPDLRVRDLCRSC
ncbi:tyrosine-type recombinase/integrase [Mycobacterium asiaticum]|uniref:Integrase n=1 Tax=Mycobacterium asiaticum TaxID=1790 RepID=A0A1A3KVQ3_MYCAS|nr:site-specific integrase [Mycobacterium asiaticum]OBJ89085.1 hypothetical protein A5640_03335 [Mycobacterium asiaticum]